MKLGKSFIVKKKYRNLYILLFESSNFLGSCHSNASQLLMAYPCSRSRYTTLVMYCLLVDAPSMLKTPL
jgi:hypothetical protein